MHHVLLILLGRSLNKIPPAVCPLFSSNKITWIYLPSVPLFWIMPHCTFYELPNLGIWRSFVPTCFHFVLKILVHQDQEFFSVRADWCQQVMMAGSREEGMLVGESEEASQSQQAEGEVDSFEIQDLAAVIEKMERLLISVLQLRLKTVNNCFRRVNFRTLDTYMICICQLFDFT